MPGLRYPYRSYMRFGVRLHASADDSAGMEKEMKSRTRLRTMPKSRPDLFFAGLVAFVILLCMLIRTIDMLSIH